MVAKVTFVIPSSAVQLMVPSVQYEVGHKAPDTVLITTSSVVLVQPAPETVQRKVVALGTVRPLKVEVAEFGELMITPVQFVTQVQVPVPEAGAVAARVPLVAQAARFWSAPAPAIV